MNAYLWVRLTSRILIVANDPYRAALFCDLASFLRFEYTLLEYHENANHKYDHYCPVNLEMNMA